MTPREVLASAKTILIIDWPSKDVPESLTRAGFQVIVKGGPGPEDYVANELIDGNIVTGRKGPAPDRAELVYSHRPISELPEILQLAKTLGAKTIWTQSGVSDAGVDDSKGCWVPDEDLRKMRALIQTAGLTHVSEPYIGDAARGLVPLR